MNKKTRITTIIMAAALSTSMALSTAACASTEANVDDGKTINVKLYSAGYGTDYIYAMQKKFEAAYKDEGYKLNIFTPQASFSGELFLQDIATGNGADLYIGGSVTDKMLQSYEGTVLDITELVANQKPIGFDGEPSGDKTIAEILEASNYGYNAYKRADGSYYSIPWTAGIRGLAVNTAVLEDYELELPKTSKEFFHCFDVIMETAGDTGVFPITQISTSNNYPVSFTSGWLAQYEGYDWYKKFFSFEENGTKLSKEDAQDLFNAKGVSVMLENIYHALDPNTATFGSKAQNVEKAQAKLMGGNCAFMMNGDWMLQETYSNYNDSQRANITFIRVPILSELGVKVFGEGTVYNKSEDECETILRAIVDEVDLDKDIADIKTAVDSKLSMNIATADIETIAKARGYTYTESNESGMYINNSSKVKDIAALFVRMCASEEGGTLISENTLACNPFVSEYQTSRYDWVNQARKIVLSKYFQGIRTDVTGYRSTIDGNFTDFFPYTGTYLNLRIIEQGISMYDAETRTKLSGVTEAVYTSAAQTLQQNIYNDVSKNYNNKW